MGVSRTSISLFSIGLLSGPKRCNEDEIKPDSVEWPMAAGSAVCLVGEELDMFCVAPKSIIEPRWSVHCLPRIHFPLSSLSASQFSIGKHPSPVLSP